MELKPYYTRSNKAFYKKGKKKMIVEKEATGVYNFYGQIITDVRIANPFTSHEADIKFPQAK